MAFTFDRAEYHKICWKINERALRFMHNNLPEALNTNDVQMIFDIYIKLFRAKSKIAVDESATNYDYFHLERLLYMMKHFLSMNECFDFLKVRCEILQREKVYSSGEETDDGETDCDTDSRNSSTDEDYVDSDNDA